MRFNEEFRKKTYPEPETRRISSLRPCAVKKKKTYIEFHVVFVLDGDKWTCGWGEKTDGRSTHDKTSFGGWARFRLSTSLLRMKSIVPDIRETCQHRRRVGCWDAGGAAAGIAGAGWAVQKEEIRNPKQKGVCKFDTRMTHDDGKHPQ